MQIVQMVAEQMQGGQQQAPQQMPQEMSQEMAQGMPQEMGQQMPMAQMGMGGGGGDFEEFGFDAQNPLNPYYQNLYDPSEAKQVNASLVEGLYNAGQDLFSQPIAGAKRRQADTQAKLQQLQKYFTTPQAQYGGMTNYNISRAQVGKPDKTTEADFETWYNTELGKLISAGDQSKINAFVNQARQTAYDYGYNPNQLGFTNLNTNTVAGSRDSKYDTELETLIKNSESEYDNAMLNNADSAALKAIEDKRTKDMDALNKKYAVTTNKIAADSYGMPSQPGNKTSTTTNNTTTNNNTTNTGGGAGGYQFNPAMQQLLSAMAQGYTKTPLFGFRTNRNINALFNQTMADMMLRSQGQGQGTTGTTGAGIPGVPAMGPNGMSNTWLKDNNINRYDITQNPNKFKMRIRANQPGQGPVQYDDSGNLVTPNNESFIDKARDKASRWGTVQGPTFFPGNVKNLEAPVLTRQFNPMGYGDQNFRSDIRNDKATERLTNIGNKLDRLYQKDASLKGWYENNPGLSNRAERRQDRLENRYNKIANKFERSDYAQPRAQAGGQYKEGGTYYLSDEEIQALISAGYELE
jgi:hypothetical protein